MSSLILLDMTHVAIVGQTHPCVSGCVWLLTQECRAFYSASPVETRARFWAYLLTVKRDTRFSKKFQHTNENA
jgi:hypothetical protein